MTPAPLLSLSDVSKHYAIATGRRREAAGGTLRAVDRVSLDIMPSETFALVGESGSGKSTLGRAALRLTDVTQGSVSFEGADVTTTKGRALHSLRPRMQAVFQDPLGSLDPRMTAGAIVAEPLMALAGMRGSELDDRVDELFRSVGLDRLPARIEAPGAVGRATPAGEHRQGHRARAAAHPR